MKRRTWMAIAAAVVVLVGGGFAYDALVVTDEERLEELVEQVTGPVEAARMNAAIERWIDLSRQPFEVSAMGQSLLYREGEDAALAERAADAVRELRGANLRPLSTAIRVEGDTATIDLRLLSRERGMGQAQWRLRRHGEEWLLERLAVTR